MPHRVIEFGDFDDLTPDHAVIAPGCGHPSGAGSSQVGDELPD
jgi:hypothetical protein